MPESHNYLDTVPQPHSHLQISDDIAFLDDCNSGSRSNRGETRKGESSSRLRDAGKWLTGLAVAATIAFAGWIFYQGQSAEKQHANWKHVAAATEVSAQSSGTLLTHVDSAGKVQSVQDIEVGRDDRDFVTTSAVRRALFVGDNQSATAAWQDAQETRASTDLSLQSPEIAPGSKLETELKWHRQEFFKVHLFDCCDEDGDVVDILVNGNVFATVPITHKGMTLSIPLRPGNNTITMRGVKDGQGGITVSFATSRGNYYCRAMRVGEEYTMGVVAR